MKCRIEFEYTEEEALAVARRYGWDRPATHEEMRSHFKSFGNSALTDLLYEMQTGKVLSQGE